MKLKARFFFFFFAYRCSIASTYVLNHSSSKLVLHLCQKSVEYIWLNMIYKTVFCDMFSFRQDKYHIMELLDHRTYLCLIHSYQQLMISLVDFIFSHWILNSISSWFQFVLSWWPIALNTFLCVNSLFW